MEYYKNTNTGKMFVVDWSKQAVYDVSSIPAGVSVSQGAVYPDKVANNYGLKYTGSAAPAPAPDPFASGRSMAFGDVNTNTPALSYSTPVSFTSTSSPVFSSSPGPLPLGDPTDVGMGSQADPNLKNAPPGYDFSGINSGQDVRIGGQTYQYRGNGRILLLPGASGGISPPILPGYIGYIEKNIEEIVNSVVSSGKTINPEYDLAGLTIEDFMKEAERVITPQFKEKFEIIKNDLSRKLTEIGYDLNLIKEKNERETKRNLETGEEELAGRGLAFSGDINRFREDTAATKQRADEAARTLAFRGAQDVGSGAEEKIGTFSLQGVSLPSIEGRSPFSFSGTPLVGSYEYDRRNLQSEYAQNLEKKTRELVANYPAIDRTSITRSLGFA